MSDQQQHLFETEPAAWELDDQTMGRVATVVFANGPDGQFDYLVPDRLASVLEPGHRVQVPFGRGRQVRIGYCVAVETRALGPRALKEIQKPVDEQCLLSDSMLELTGWMAERYLCRWGQVLEAVLPAGVRGQAGTRQVTFLSVAEPAAADAKLPAKQAHALAVLAAAPQALTPGELAKEAGCTQAPITALRKKGLVVASVQRVRNAPAETIAPSREEALQLDTHQQTALDAICGAFHSGKHATILVHGVTGSGKTEVYMQAIREMIGFGRQAIVLVPEISLTPQTRQRFRRRFDRVAVLHSHLTDAERAWHWEQIARGQVEVVVGARSAIFAPTPNLGLIVLDEEHESSFKQSEAPRYHARDVAVRRAQTENIPLVLGSATPSLESWQHAVAGDYQLVSMPHRVAGRPLPDVATIDLKSEEHARGPRGAITRPLQAAMRAALADGGQVILLLNRRGFSTHIQCPACGNVVQCPECEIALTHHRQQQLAMCHYCDYHIPPPVVCPDCKFSGIRYSGLGTQKLEQEVRARFPDEACLRMDTDSMRKAGSHEQALESFRQGQVRILVGTQMIAKGLDFPNVTLVGVINADTALHLPDFRAAERTFQLVTQVAGRTGRGEKGGRVLVQTFNPDHLAIQAAVRHNYARFADAELPTRQTHGYPPFAAMLRVVVRGPAEQTVRGFAEHLADQIRHACGRQQTTVRILGPAAAPIPKLRGKFRFHFQLQSPMAEPLRAAVHQATAGIQAPDGVQWIADVDPLDML